MRVRIDIHGQGNVPDDDVQALIDHIDAISAAATTNGWKLRADIMQTQPEE